MPNAAVHRGAPNGVITTFVYLVNADNTVSVRPVTLGVVDGERVAVTAGLAAGDVVVTEGGDRLRDGAQVMLPDAAPARRRRRDARGTRCDARQHRRDVGRTHAWTRPTSPHESVTHLHPAPGGHHAADGRDPDRRRCIAYLQLPLSALPEVAYPTIQVQTFYPGASPEVITSAITAPLEKQFGQMPGLNQMSSTSSAGASVITLQFNLSLAIDVAEQEVQAAISAAQNLLPQDLPAPPIYAKVNPADAPVLTLGITSKVMPLTEVEDLADTRIAQKISQLKGVGVVSISGGQRPAVRVRRQSAGAGGLRTEHRRSAHHHQQRQPERAEGHARRPEQRLLRSIPTIRSQSAEEYGNDRHRLPQRRAGPSARCRDAGRRRREHQARRLDEHDPGADHERAAPARRQRRRCRRPHRSAAAVSCAARCPRASTSPYSPTAPPRSAPRSRTSSSSWRSPVALVVLVIFLFLRNVPATIIPSLSVPLSLIGTFAVMYLAHFSLNNLSLMALTIATGFVVDDAIVMIENISRYIERGDSPLEAALQGLRADRLHDHLADRVADRGADSAAVHAGRGRPAVPRIRRDARGHDPDLRGRVADAGADAVRASCSSAAAADQVHAEHHGTLVRRRRGTGTARRLTWVLDHQPPDAVRRGSARWRSPRCSTSDPQGLLSGAGHRADPGRVRGRRVDLLRRHGRAPAGARRGDPAGPGRREPVLVHRYRRQQRHPQQRPLPDQSETARQRARHRHARSSAGCGARPPRAGHHAVHAAGAGPDARHRPSAAPSTSSRCESADAARAQRMDAEAGRAPARSSRNSPTSPATRTINGLAAYVTIDRDSAARLGISVGTVDNALYDAFGQRIVSTIFTQSNQYRVIMEADPALQRSLAALDSIYVPSAAADRCRCRRSPRSTQETRPLLINHLAQFPATTVSFNLAAGVSLGAAVTAIETGRARLWPCRPASAPLFRAPPSHFATISATSCCCCSRRCS